MFGEGNPTLTFHSFYANMYLLRNKTNMSDVPSPEQLAAPLAEMAEVERHEIGRVQQLAEEQGIQDQVRIAALLDKSRAILEAETPHKRSGFRKDGIWISGAEDGPDGFTHGVINFMPRTEKYPRGATVTQRGEGSRVMLQGIRVMQDYVLLADAGVLAPPDVFEGTTNNAQMAKVAERLGFQAADDWDDTGKVSGDFDVIRKRVFSPKVRQVEQVLERRLARTTATVGATALSS